MDPLPAPAWERCPFCGLEMFPEREELSLDHIFGEALGGRTLVTAHKSCNNQSGSGAEGALQRPDTIFNLIKANHGLKAQRIPATFSSGRKALFDPQQGTVFAHPTVDKSVANSIRIEGTPTEAEAAFNKWRSRQPDFERIPEFKNLPPEAVARVSYTHLSMNLRYPYQAAERVAIKSALGACTLAYGPGFATSPFAAALRALEKSEPDPDRRFDLKSLDQFIAGMAGQFGLNAAAVGRLPTLVPPPGATVHDVVLVPLPTQTVLFAHYLSQVTPPYGIKINARLPQLLPGITPTLPLLLRDDTPHHLKVTDFTQLLLRPVITAAEAEERRRFEGGQ
ncbi:HNH endonuclease [Actinacidiphila oryziradicis]|uniref:HNH endonuclease n=1 Tax=Actinacidiphila oryziradicis TaxID=2571141 RepID=A0A4U0SMS6_9ACTN|nr:HNH endonuclease [Actinacidiphila oryziradicis]TKA09511.1 HNH endonuclease [Actinacidiphila oryziradicis]